MTEKPEASVLTARRAAQHFRLSSADDACEHLYILIVRSSLGPSPPNAGRYTVASRFRRRTYARGYIFPRAPERFVASPLCLVGYVRWDARSDRVPPLQTIIFSSFPGRTPVCRPLAQNASFLAFHTANLDSWLLAQNLVSVLRRTGSADSAEHSRSSCAERPGCSKAAKWSPFFSSLSPPRRAFGRRLLQRRTP